MPARARAIITLMVEAKSGTARAMRLQARRFYRLRLLEGQSFVPLPPSIITQPASQTVFLGQNANFSVVATGNEPLACQ